MKLFFWKKKLFQYKEVDPDNHDVFCNEANFIFNCFKCCLGVVVLVLI